MLKNTSVTKEIVRETVNESCGGICSTMSPNGYLVTISKSGMPFTTKDGKTVANAIQYEDKAKDLIALQIAQATTRTDELCGDGTTTTAFLIREFFNRFDGKLDFRKHQLIKEMTAFSVDAIKRFSLEVDIKSPLLRDVLLTTSNNEPSIVDKVLEIYQHFSTYPKFILKDGTSEEDTYVVNPSMQYRGGYADPRFSRNGQGSTETFVDYIPYVYEGSLASVLSEKETFGDFFGLTSGTITNTPIVLISRGFDDETKNYIGELNSLLKFRKFILATVTGAGTSGTALMKDISTVLGVTLRGGWFVNGNETPTDLPALTLSTGNISFKPTTETQTERVMAAAEAVNQAYAELDVDTRRSALGAIILNRYEALTGSTVTLYVGGVVDSDVTERKDRFEDVYKVARSALKNGIIRGCGQTLADVGKLVRLKFGTANNDPEIVEQYALALEAQSRFLLGYDETVKRDDFVYVNLATGDSGKDAGELNIWDASLAAQTALEAGVKTAMLLINTSCIVLGNRLGSVHF